MKHVLHHWQLLYNAISASTCCQDIGGEVRWLNICQIGKAVMWCGVEWREHNRARRRTYQAQGVGSVAATFIVKLKLASAIKLGQVQMYPLDPPHRFTTGQGNKCSLTLKTRPKGAKTGPQVHHHTAAQGVAVNRELQWNGMPIITN